MDQVSNPYSPGAGARPSELAGRSSELADMDVALQRALIGRSGKSQLITGLWGVGKTVLLHEFGRVAVKRGFIYEHIEVRDAEQLPLQIAVAVRKALLKLGGKKKAKGANRRALGVLKAFAQAHPAAASLQNEAEVVAGVADSGDLGSDLGGLFEEVGGAARSLEAGVFLTVDEMHHLPSPALKALLLGLHRTSEMGLPFVLAGAALPSL